MGDEPDFKSAIAVSAFCAGLWGAGRVCKRFGVSTVIGEILVGVLLGPAVIDLVPFSDVFELAGLVGVTLMVFESGLHVDFVHLREVGVRAGAVATVGTFLPIGAGVGAMRAFGFPVWPVGLAVGVALAPTSVGMALRLLAEAGLLSQHIGQLVVAAAFFDDVLSLVALTLLLEIGDAIKEGVALDAWSISRPLVEALALCVLTFALAMPIERSPTDGPVRRYAFGWAGIFPRAFSHLSALAAREHIEKAPAGPAWHSVGSDESTRQSLSGGAGPTFVDAPEAPQEAEASGSPDTAPQQQQTFWMREARASQAHIALDRYDSIEAMLAHLPDADDDPNGPLDPSARATLAFMFCTLTLFCAVAEHIGSHLLGAFLAGMCFSTLHGGLALWHSQCKRIAAWLIRFFFAATVGFAVPVRAMLSARALGLGVLLALGPACLTKLTSGLLAGPTEALIVGVAMLGRGEFAFLVAETARSTLLNPAPKTFAHESARLLPSGRGYYCYDGDCGPDGAKALGMSAEAGETGRAYQAAAQWCAHCVLAEDGSRQCDLAPAPGRRYWALGPECDARPAECDCVAMMDADSFAVCMWALVLASVLAPLGFAAVLRRRRARASASGPVTPRAAAGVPGAAASTVQSASGALGNGSEGGSKSTKQVTVASPPATSVSWRGPSSATSTELV